MNRKIFKNYLKNFSILKVGLFLLFTVHCPLSTFLYAGTASTSANFLLENLSARSVAMGGVYTATVEGSDSIYTNPAGLSLSQNPEINLSYASTQIDSLYSFLGYAHPVVRSKNFRMGFGGGITYYSAGNMDVNYNDGTTRSLKAETGYSGMVSMGMKYKWLGIGLTPKFIRSSLVENYTASTLGADIGMMIFPLQGSWHERLVLAGAYQNLGGKISYKSEETDLPKTYSFGTGIRVLDHKDYGSILVSAQSEKTLGESARYRMGGEYGIGLQTEERLFFLRGGYGIHCDDENFSIGIGFREKNLQLDYAFVNSNELEKIHKVTLLFRFGKFIQKKRKDYDMPNVEEEIYKKEKYQLSEENEKENQKKIKKDTDYQLLDPDKDGKRY